MSFISNEVIKYITGDYGCIDDIKIKLNELCQNILNEFNNNLNEVPEVFKTEELCILSIKENKMEDGSTIKYIPKHILNESIYKLAIDINPKSKQYIPVQYHNLK